MKIVDFKTELYTIPHKADFYPSWYPGRIEKEQNILLLRVLTDEGIEGLSSMEAPFGLYEVQMATFNYLRPLIIGEDPFLIEKIMKKVKYAGIPTKRPWAFENALWDIIGKASNQPVFRILGSERDRVPIYAAWGELRTPEQRVQDAYHLLDVGFKAVKIRFQHDDVRDDLAVVEAIRKSVGDRLTIMVDANQATAPERSTSAATVWDLKRAVYTAQALEELDVFWLEEPRPMFDYDGLAKVKQSVNMHIAGGEINRGLNEFKTYLDRGCYDILQPNCTLAASISEIRKIAALAEAYGKLCTPHNWIPGVGQVASMHLVAAIHNSTYLEYPYDPPALVPEVFQGILANPVLVEKDGCVKVPEGPGFGVELDQAALKKYLVK